MSSYGGLYECQLGVQSVWYLNRVSCGLVDELGVTVYANPGGLLNGETHMTGCATPGDSGAGVVSSYTAYGIENFGLDDSNGNPYTCQNSPNGGASPLGSFYTEASADAAALGVAIL